MEDITFKKSTGKESAVKVITETLIDGGIYGNIFDAVIEIGGHKKRMIIKRYLDESDHAAKQEAQTAFNNYMAAKKAGLKIFPTFRIGDDQRSILMTTGFKDGNLCIGNNSRKDIRHFGAEPLKRIEQTDKFFKDFFSEGLKAAREKLIIAADAPFLIISKAQPTKLDYVIGDLDDVLPHDNLIWEELKHLNLENLRRAILRFARRNIDHSLLDEFNHNVESFYNKALTSEK